ncbi:MAG: DeoR family transcriptional regulator [Propionibacteriales bacterium]|nr:DeoR family transcriptional regulator [Propionibacteriales bacterium]
MNDDAQGVEPETSAEVQPEARGDRSWRLRSLLDLLSQRGRLSVSDAATELGVSEATVRRDFTSLAKQQLVTRTHGGVVATSVAYDLPVRYRGGGDADVKERIAVMASELITPGKVVGFNGGTTSTATARRLAARGDLAESGGKKPMLTVVTNALNIATEMVLRPHIRTVTLGGVARPQSYELVGPLAMQVLGELWLDHLILGVDGFSMETGASCFHEGEAGVNALMVQRASEVTVVMAAEKLGVRTFARICDVTAVTTVVTDEAADPNYVEALRAKGLRVLLA